MANTSTVVNAFQKYYANDGVTPLGGGLLTFFANKTTNLISVFSDPALTVAQTNPDYVLDAGGRIQGDVRFAGTASILIKDSTGATQRTDDDNVCFTGSTSFDLWDSAVTYGSGGTNLVTGSDGLYYVSIATANINNDPASGASPTKWSQVKFVGVWNTNETYAIDDVVQASDGMLYRAAVAQSGNDPLGDKTNWKPLSPLIYAVADTYEIGDVVQDSTGLQWRSLTAANSGNTPNSSPTNWASTSRRSFTSGITASTTQTQGAATALVAELNVVATVANASDSVKLKTAAAVAFQTIINNGANALQVFPASGDAIDGGSVDAADANLLGAGSTRTYNAIDATNWDTDAEASAAGPGDNVVIVFAGNGYGSTNTKIRRFTTTQEDTGSDITFAQSAADGDSFTINAAGFYNISYTDGSGANAQKSLGVSLNSNQLTTNIASITSTTLLGITEAIDSEDHPNVSSTVLLAVSDVVRAHTDGNPNRTDIRCRFAIRRVG